MSLPPPALLLALLLLGTNSSVWAQSSACQAGVRRLELKEGAAPPAEICIGPGLSTTLLFDRELTSGVELEGRARFERVDSGGRSIILVPSAKLAPGERLRLTVRFTGTEAPTSAVFVLVVHLGEADRQVDISRAARRPEVCQAELERKEAELQRCLRTAPGSGGAQGSLALLLAENAFGRQGLQKRELSFQPPVLAPGAALQVAKLKLHRIERRLVLEMKLANLDPSKPWRAAGARVTTRLGQALETLVVVQNAPRGAEDSAPLWVELLASDERLLEGATLQLWDEAKARTLTLPGLKLQ